MRRTTLLRAALALIIQANVTAAVPPPPAAPSVEKINQLVVQLSSNAFRQREAATKELEAIGEPALEALKKAAESADMEVAARAKSLVERITARVENDRRLAPALVELKFKDTPIEQAIAELTKQSGSPIQLGGDRSRLTGRTVTLETGRVPFWVALERLCAAANLREADPAAPTASTAKALTAERIAVAQQAQVNLRLFASYDVESVSAGVAASIVLADGKPDPVPAHLEGAVRVRLAAIPGSVSEKARPGELLLGLGIHAEPRLKLERIFGIKVDRALDDRGQNLEQMLAVSADATNALALADERERRLAVARLKVLADGSVTYPTMPYIRAGVVELRLKKGTQESKVLHEVRGSIAATLRTPDEELVAIDNPLQAKPGTSARGKGDVMLRLVSIKEMDNGDYEVSAEVQHTSGVHVAMPGGGATKGAGGRAALNGAPPTGPANNSYGIMLFGEKDQPFDLVTQRGGQLQMSGTSRIVTVTQTFRPRQKGLEPVKIAFWGNRAVPVEVPFALKDVPLR